MAVRGDVAGGAICQGRALGAVSLGPKARGQRKLLSRAGLGCRKGASGRPQRLGTRVRRLSGLEKPTVVGCGSRGRL